MCIGYRGVREGERVYLVQRGERERVCVSGTEELERERVRGTKRRGIQRKGYLNLRGTEEHLRTPKNTLTLKT